jgi:hypothetical protein
MGTGSKPAQAAADGASQWYKFRIVVPPAASIIIPEGIWEPVITGLRENRVIGFEYSGIWDDGVVICFSSTRYYKILEWVLSRGCTARPLAPKALVKD